MGNPIVRSSANGEVTPWDRIDTCYDGVGNVRFTSNPYQSASPTSAPNCSGAGDSFSYDPLNRVRTLTHSDSTVVSTSYSGGAMDVVDEGNGTHSAERISQVDSLGRLVSVCEVTGSTQLGSGGSPTACGQDINLTYAQNPT
jgi:hypothetical protein